MGSKTFLKPLAIALALVLAPTLTAQAVHTISFKDMTPLLDGNVVYSVHAVVTKEKVVRMPTELTPNDDPWAEPPPETETITVTQRIDLLGWKEYVVGFPSGSYLTRALTEQEVLALGVPQADIDRTKSTPGAIDVVFFETAHITSSYWGNSFVNVDIGDRAQGSVILNATLPANPPGNLWTLKVVSALGERRTRTAQLAAGLHRMTITDVEAGNVLVTLYATDTNGGRSTYFQEVHALVRKYGATGAPGGDGADTVEIGFAEPNSPNRFRLGHLGAGHNSQSHRANLPLQRGREAMVRVMAHDTWGAGGGSVRNMKIGLEWESDGGPADKLFTSHVSGYHTRSGLIFPQYGEADMSRNESYGLGPKIPARYVRPGLEIKAQLFGLDNQPVAAKCVELDVVKPREIDILAWDVTITSGSWHYGDKSENINKLLQFVEDVFPYAKIRYGYRGKKVVPYATTMQGVLDVIHAESGGRATDSRAEVVVLHLGFTDIIDPSVGGLAYLNRTSIAVGTKNAPSYSYTPEVVGQTVAHEMGHCFNLGHAPGRGAPEPDHNFPYGGGGLTAGWGYSMLTDEFFAEDGHSPDKWSLDLYWDIMSYAKGRRPKFSDYYVAKLEPKDLVPSGPPMSPWVLPPLQMYPGTQTLIFGPEAARAVEAAWEMEMGIGQPQNPQQAGSDNTVDLVPGLDDPPRNGEIVVVIEEEDQQSEGFDLDAYMQGLIQNDGTLPTMVYTAIPRFRGITPVVCR